MIITTDYISMIIPTLGALGILTAIALFLYHILKREREFQEKEKHTIEDYQTVLKKAHKESEEMLDATTQTIKQILDETKATNENISEVLTRALQQVATHSIQNVKQETSDLEKTYKQELQTVEKTIQNNADALIQQTQQAIIQQLTDHHTAFIKKATAAEAMLDKRTQELHEQIDVEVATYKKAQYEKLNQQIMGLMMKTYQEVLHRTMPDDVQQELIMEALEQARKEDVFK